MRVTYETLPHNHADACRQLEAACEGIVVAMVEEIDAWPEGTYPCCIKCGGFCTRNGPLTPAQAQAIEFTLEHGHPRASDRIELEGVLTDHGYHMPDDAAVAGVEYGVPPTDLDAVYDGPFRNTTDPFWYEACVPDHQRQTAAPPASAAIHVRSARQILACKSGTTVELACYQCAQKRRHADPGAKVKILCTAPGTFRAVVLCSRFHEKPERRGAIDDPVEDAKPHGGCGCAIHGEDAPQ